ncbi:MAG: putative endonuclease 4 [candidate division TM6 bacterium GW2011_GWF2_32_72]|nr:MAG: putative endonuclease 4 [candidate division TM6 bacterium GW2011_GWF2_32_72]
MSHNLKNPLLGAHMLISDGFDKAIEKGESINCTAIQIFTKSNRQWRAKQITEKEISDFKLAWKNSSVEVVIAHASYLINLASPDKDIQKKSIEALAIELERCEQLGIPYLVLHPGSSLESSIQDALLIVAENIDNALEQISTKTNILLETMAGQGSSLGKTFEQLAEIRKHIKHKEKIGFCFDTCHAFAAGYDFSNPKSYKIMWKHFDDVLGLANLKAIHVNDSKFDQGSQKDRHENIGKGKIGIEAFRLIMNDKNLINVPKILETPKDKDLKEDQINLKTLKKLIV